MNKQELIERLNNKLDETFAFQQSFKPLTWTHMECESKANAYMTAINYVEQLGESEKNLASTIKLLTNLEPDDFLKELKLYGLAKEPQKVKVPEFMKEFLDFCIEDEQNGVEAYHGLFHICSSWPKDDILQWSFEDPYRFVNAFQYGYEVEEEPKWKIINDQKYCLTSIEAGYGNSLHWAFDSTKKKPILFDNEETAMYTAYITGGIVEKVEV